MIKRKKVTLETFLNGNTSIEFNHKGVRTLSQCLTLTEATGGKEESADTSVKNEIWLIDVLDDGTAISYCVN